MATASSQASTSCSAVVVLSTRSSVEQRVVAQVEGVRFWSKIDLVEKIIRTFRPVPGTHTHVLVDAWYTCKRLWKVARGRGIRLHRRAEGKPPTAR